MFVVCGIVLVNYLSLVVGLGGDLVILLWVVGVWD